MQRGADGGMNRADAFRHRLGLRFAVIAGDGMKLTIRIRNTNRVPVDQDQVADARAGKRFRRPGADAT